MGPRSNVRTKHILFKCNHCTFKFKVTICQLVHLIKTKQNRKMETFDLLLGCQLISDLL